MIIVNELSRRQLLTGITKKHKPNKCLRSSQIYFITNLCLRMEVSFKRKNRNDILSLESRHTFPGEIGVDGDVIP